MGFGSGSVTCRMFYVPNGLPHDAVERFAEHAAPPIETLGRGRISGWVTSRHLLDRNITPESAAVAGYLFLYLMQAERKIPPALLRAECRMAELAEMQARDVEFLRRAERTEIKKAVVERLLPDMPPALRGSALVYDPQDRIGYASATSDKQLDVLTHTFQRTTGVPLIPMDPETVAMHRTGVPVRDLDPTCFVPEFEYAGQPGTIGQDFLTWLWYVSEERFAGRAVALDGVGSFGFLLEGPLTFEFEGQGAHETTLRKGAPMVSYEARAALMAGKKLRRANLAAATGEAMWSATFDADTFTFRGLKLPKGEALDPVSRFQDRMLSLRTFREAVLTLYEQFLKERTNRSNWESLCKTIFQWVENRTAKR